MSNIQFVIATKLGFVNKSHRDAKLNEAKLFKTLPNAKRYAEQVEDAQIHRVEVSTKFGLTSVNLLGLVSEQELAETKALDSVSETTFVPKDVFVIGDGEGKFFNKKGELTADASKAFTSKNPDRLAGISVGAGVSGYILPARISYVGTKYVLEVQDPKVVEPVYIPVETERVTLVDGVITVY